MNGLALFAGVGGLDLGINLILPESRAVCYVEGEAYAASVLAKQMEKGRLHPAPIWSNVVTFDGTPWRGKVDFISAGFPCQPWSVAGKQKGIEDERWLWDHIERIICEVQPRFLFLENVPGLINGGLSPVLKSLAKIGFNAEWGTLRASDVGAKHHRNRLFIFGYIPDSKCVLDGYRRLDQINTGIVSQWQGDTRRSYGNKSRLQPSKEEGCDEGDFPNSQRGGWNENQLNTSKRQSDVIGFGKNREWWSIEPGLGRMVDGVAHRVDRLRACGNGVVPLQAGVAYSILINRAIEGGALNEN